MCCVNKDLAEKKLYIKPSVILLHFCYFFQVKSAFKSGPNVQDEKHCCVLRLAAHSHTQMISDHKSTLRKIICLQISRGFYSPLCSEKIRSDKNSRRPWSCRARLVSELFYPFRMLVSQ